MRPDRFESSLIAAAGALPGVSGVKPFRDLGGGAPLYGAVCTFGEHEMWVQVTCRTAPGDDLSKPEEMPRATGPRQGGFRPCDGSPVDSLPKMERALAAELFDQSGPDGESEAFDFRLYSGDEQSAIQNGMKIDYHDGSTVFLNITEGRPRWW